MIDVYLIGGPGPWAGTVYARNPVTGIDGPVCDDYWNILAVRIVYFCINTN
jgi:hypothetical protein